jgi:hypothetical protein
MTRSGRRRGPNGRHGLKKFLSARRRLRETKGAKVFWFFFSKKNALLVLP